MNKGVRGTGLYILAGLLLILLIFTLRDSFNGRSDITSRELKAMLDDGKVRNTGFEPDCDIKEGLARTMRILAGVLQ